MGDAAKRVKNRGFMDEEDFKRSPGKQSYLAHDGHGNNLGRKLDTQKSKPIPYSTSPRNGSSQNMFKNFSPGGRAGTNYKDEGKRWSAEEQRGYNNWRERRPQAFNRTRNDSTGERGEGFRWQEAGERQNQLGRSPLQKGAFPEDASDHTGISAAQNKQKRDRRRYKSEQDEDDCLESPVIDESTLSEKELLGLQQAEERLKRDCIYRLRRRPRRYPTAIYCCKLCDTLVDSVSSAHKHIKEKRHKRSLKEKKEEELLTTLPPPIESQLQAIGIAIGKVVQEHGLDEEDLVERLSTVSAMEALIQENLPGCSLRLYGSSCSRMGFKNSDLNIDIQFPASMNQPDVLLLVQDSLKQSDLFVDFDADFHARVPVVVCAEKRSGRLCKVSAGNENACLTTNLLTTLGFLESRLIPLVVAFRYWAKLCGIDRPEEGGLPPYVLALMVVFFLQQRKESVLPVYLGSWIESFSVSKLGQFSLGELNNEFVNWVQTAAGDGESLLNEQCQLKGKVPVIFPVEQCSASVGQLWVDLLRFYALEFNMGDFVITVRVKEKISRELKDWPKKRIAVEDPYSVKRNVARSLNSQIVFEFMLHCLKATYKYFAMPQNKSKKLTKKPTNSTLKGIRRKTDGESEPQSNPVLDASQKLERLAIDNTLNASSVDINHKAVNKKLVFDTLPDLAIEDYCRTEETLANPKYAIKSCDGAREGSDGDHPVPKKERQSDYILIGHGFDDDSESGEAHVAGNEETDSLSDFEGGAEGHDFSLESTNMYAGKVDLDEESTEGTDELEEIAHDFEAQRFDLADANNSDEDDDDDEENSLLLNRREHLDSLTADEELENTYTGSADDLLSEDDQQTEPVSKILQDHEKGNTELRDTLEDEDPKQLATESCGTEDAVLFYEFNKPTFTRGKLPTVVCNLCKKEGHLKKDCPEDFKKIELEPLPPLTAKFSQILDQVCMQCYTDFSPSALEGKAREHIRQDLEDFIRRDFHGARLNLFGSSKNGFGFIESDLDICLTFDGLETAEGLDSIRTIEELARHLRKHQGLRNILPITTAKVPIVKFYHVRSGLEGDISLYNTLALHNTRLLASYAAIDPRVKYLCYIMKVFTKVCDIGDASRGSLSSYAYTLMVLYFLQQRDPPVIPVLQEIYLDSHKPEKLVDGWNVYFFDKLDELAKYWPDYGKNKESPGELWLGLLRFYTEDFDFKEHVISIRRKSLLTTFKKQWTSKYIVIEDPFDLNHNLGAGLSRKMTNFIMKGFINGRRLFGTPMKIFPKEYRSTVEYFFDSDVLTEGELAPNDRCCRICGKIGHFMKDCPMRRKVRRRNPENAANQRYQDKRPQRIEDKEMSMQGGGVSIDGRELHTTPRKAQGPWGNNEPGKDRTPPRSGSEKWRRQDDREPREKRCFICGREGHIKKECPQYKGAAGSPKSDILYGSPSAASPQKPQTRFIPVVPSQDDRKKQKMSLTPQLGSLLNKYVSQGKASQKRTQQE